MTETQIQKEISDYLKALGFKVYRMNSGYIKKNVKLAEDGTPDLMTAADRGRSLWIEVKVPGNLPSEIQKRRHAELRALGHVVIVAYSLEDVKKGLAR